MNKQKALETLRLTQDNPDREMVLKAYSRLTRRYPKQNFPEKNQLIITARDALLQPDLEIKEDFFADQLDLFWLKSRVKEKSSAPPLAQEVLDRQNFLRPAIVHSLKQVPRTSPMFAPFMDDMDDDFF